jgi:hypothetical protein
MKHLVVQGVVLHGDVAEYLVVEGGGALAGHLLADDVRLPRGGAAVGFLPGKQPAGILGPGKARPASSSDSVLLAEAAVGVAPLHQKLGVFLVKRPCARSARTAHRAAHVRALVVVKAAFGHGLVDDVHRALHQAALVGVLDAQDEGAPRVAGDEPGIKRRAEIAHVHVARGGGREAGAHLSPLGMRASISSNHLFIVHFV